MLLFAICFVALFLLCCYIRTSLPQMGLTIRISVIASFIMSAFIALFQNGKKRDYADIEHGSAQWGKKADLKPYIDKAFQKNIILSRTEFLSMDMRKTGLNCHVLVVGGSGAGKSRYYARPNIMQMNASYVVTDPSGELLRDTGNMLQEAGYQVRVFDTVSLKNSMRFNPFVYFRDIKDIRKFINIFMANTNGDTNNQNHTEDFWAKSERLWLMAHISYVFETCSPEEQTMNSVLLLLNASEAREDNEEFQSAIDVLFSDLEKEKPQSFAVKQYKKYKLAAGKTAKSILVSIGVRLADFDIPEIAELFSEDELQLDRIGLEKTALFVIVDETDTTYNYLVALMLDVLFNTQKRVASEKPGGSLPVPVRCILDEVANIGRFPTIHILIATMRKYNVSFEFLLQDISQFKALYKDNWQTIEANCNTAVFLGGRGSDTTKYVSESLLGKATIDTVSYGSSGSASSWGKSGYSSNEQKSGRSLLDESEVARLDNHECIVSVKGLYPFKSKKYALEEHPNYRRLAGKNVPEYKFSRKEAENTQIPISQIDFRYVTEID